MSAYYEGLWRNNILFVDENITLEIWLYTKDSVLKGAAYCSASYIRQQESAACFDKQPKFPFTALTAMFSLSFSEDRNVL